MDIEEQYQQYQQQAYQQRAQAQQMMGMPLAGGLGGMAVIQNALAPQRATGSGSDDSEKLLLLEEEGE